MFRYFVAVMIENLLFWILIVLTAFYAVLVAFAWRGLDGLVHPKSEKMHSFSIIVAARNEEKNINELLTSLLQMDYPNDRYEIIIVNDRSTDSTQNCVEGFSKKYSNVTLISLPENRTDMPHKKNALRAGIEKARYDILAFTDADCIVPKNWLRELSAQFTDDVGIVAGYSPFTFTDTKKTFNSFLRYEELKSSLYAAAAVGLNKAYMCTGRNFAYRKKVYEEVGGFEKIKHSVSGDDDLFIQLAQRETRWNIRYMISPESYVATIPPINLRDFINQRMRHISASKHYQTRMKFIFGISHLFLVTILAAFFIAPLFALVFLLLRLNIDALIIERGKKMFTEEFTVVEFFWNEVMLIFYVTLIGPLGILKKFEWKGTN